LGGLLGFDRHATVFPRPVSGRAASSALQFCYGSKNSGGVVSYTSGSVVVVVRDVVVEAGGRVVLGVGEVTLECSVVPGVGAVVLERLVVGVVDVTLVVKVVEASVAVVDVIRPAVVDAGLAPVFDE
jgi:hypothetical protein